MSSTSETTKKALHAMSALQDLEQLLEEQGTSTKLSTHFSGTHYRNYVLYGKHIA
jgi:hypothetical protein